MTEIRAGVCDSPLIVALDYAEAEPALAMAARLDPARCRLKVGKELFTSAGPDVVRRLVDQGFDVFLDLKFHDIPNTVESAIRAATRLGVWMLNVHATGGPRMLEAARSAVESASGRRPLLTAVTVLTSMSPEELAALGIQMAPIAWVRHLAELAGEAGVDGVVCSAREVKVLRSVMGPDFLLVTPGIRPVDTEPGDQRRVSTPADALAAGSDYLVIGRPVTRSADPLAALTLIEEEVRAARAS